MKVSVFKKTSSTEVIMTSTKIFAALGLISGLGFVTTTLAKDSHFDTRTQVGGKRDRLGKLLPIFQVVRFPNDPCEVAGGSKNGTCFTEEECNNVGGSNGGSCASGFGICCIITLSCGSSSSQNCTYFEVSSPAAGQCRSEICRCNTNICSMRLDFVSFVITGPSTLSTTAVMLLNGQPSVSATVGYAETGRCLTDKFTISNQATVPEICGTNTGYHVYFEASAACNSLDFVLGSQTFGVTALATRTWNIKVTQIECTDPNRLPTGCDQFYTGTLGTFETFNFQASRHLANQHQNICFRRELGFCRICYSADAVTDVSTGAVLTNAAIAAVGGSICCAYKNDGATTGKAGAYDCIMIPGAQNAAGAQKPQSQCGNGAGLVTAAAADATGTTTVCSRSIPFRIDFYADAFEQSQAMGEATTATNYQRGFKLRYFQTTC